MHYSEWRPESQITGIAWSWVDEEAVFYDLLYQDLSNERQMLEHFLAAYEEADMVTGHYIRKHDLPLLNDHCIRAGLPALQEKLVQDTKCDLVKVKGLGASQENLSLTLGVSAEKHHMAGADWREANTLVQSGREATWKRVVDDVKQHKALRAELLDRGLLRPPRLWRP